jgi:hypothetical protein
MSSSIVYKREVSEGFSESIYQFYKTVPDGPGSETSTNYNYKLLMLEHDGEIIWFDLTEEKQARKFVWRKLKRIWYSYDERLQSQSNDSLYQVMKLSFKETFKADLNENELFSTYYVFGTACGFAGEAPPGREMINTMVNTNDRASLKLWLQSTITEKQVYAVSGLHDLKKRGIPLSEEELDLVKKVLLKKGNILACFGCSPDWLEISELKKDYPF